ncbi:hypothetical protein PQO03_14480 [Lentisphaera profundi]|uniref:Pentapeptide repeat-containing protein n=1 Tax=Lentisphaera profundi TaxID=1658616 RepID=A0ABY7W0U1_9BACT|nr:hypothetical protein [Lentisphaera profundi]WDE99040.1 hypothetical protein PQO03_14480 [Lentisphaera profundi]
MELNPNERYQQVAQLRTDLVSYLRGFVTSVERASFFIQVKLLVKRNKMVSFVMIMSSIILISATSIFLISIKKSEFEAKIATQQAREAEQEAKDNLLKWQRTNELKKLIASESLPQVLSLTHTLVNDYEVLKGIDLAKVAIEIDQNLKSAHVNLAYLQASLFEFEASIQSYLQGGIGSKNKHIIASKACFEKFKGRKDLSFDEIIWIVRTYASHNLYNMINEFTFSPKLHFLNLKQRRQYALEVLQLQNPPLQELYFEGDFIKMDSRELSDINGLYRTNIKELDLRHANLRRNIVAIRGLPLTKITLPEKNPNSQVPYLKTCKTLEQVFLPEKTTNKSLLKNLPKSFKIIFY